MENKKVIKKRKIKRKDEDFRSCKEKENGKKNLMIYFPAILSNKLEDDEGLKSK